MRYEIFDLEIKLFVRNSYPISQITLKLNKNEKNIKFNNNNFFATCI